MKTKTKWQPMETMPRDGTLVFLGQWLLESADSPLMEARLGYFDSKTGLVQVSGWDFQVKTTYFDAWCEIPEPPERSE